MQRGTIYLHKKLPFKDSFYGTKYIILLNTPGNNEPPIFVKTTSQQKSKPITPGCIDTLCLFFIPANTSYFPENTWVQLFETYTIHGIEKNKDARKVGQLDDKLIELIIKCLLTSDTEDIPPDHRKILNPPIKDAAQKLAEHFGKKKP